MIKDRLQIARGSAARITSFLNSFRDYEIIFNTDTNRLGIVLPNKTIVYIGVLDINEHNNNENAHSDIRQLISNLQGAVDNIENIIGSIDSEEDADNIINKLHEIVELLNGYEEGTTLVDLLSGKVDKESGKSLIADSEILRLASVDNYDDSAIDSRVSAIENDYLTSADLPTIPTKTSDLTNDSGFITSGDLPTLATVATSGSYTDLSDKPTIPTNTVSSTTITTIVSCTQAEYDALTPNANTLYVITG